MGLRAYFILDVDNIPNTGPGARTHGEKTDMDYSLVTYAHTLPANVNELLPVFHLLLVERQYRRAGWVEGAIFDCRSDR